LQESIEKFSFDHPLDAEIFKKIALYLKKDPLVLIEFLFTADHGSIATDLQSALAALFTDSFSLDTLVSLLQNKAYAATIKEDYRDGPFLCEWYKRLASLYRDTMKKDIPVFSSDVAVSDLQQVFIHHFSKLLEEKIKKFEAFDMGLCSYTISTGQLQYAWAMTDLIVFPSTGEWKFEKAQRSKMGKKDNSDFITFENISLDVHSWDFFLLYSDGAVDQFGGPTVWKENAYWEKDIYGKKILFKRLHEEVVRLQKKWLSAAAITEELKKFILEWRHVGTENELDQIDDITLFGVQPKI